MRHAHALFGWRATIPPAVGHAPGPPTLGLGLGALKLRPAGTRRRFREPPRWMRDGLRTFRLTVELVADYEIVRRMSQYYSIQLKTFP